MSNPNAQDSLKKLKLHQAYEKYMENSLGIIQRKVDVLVKFRLDVGKKKIRILEERLKNER